MDDYAHHPTEIRATLATAKSVGRNRVLTMFQPHRYSRTKALRREFGRAFDNADRVVVTDIYPASEAPLHNVSGQTIVDEIIAHGHRGVTYQPRLERLHCDLGNMIASGDLILSLGAGNIHEQLSILAADLVIAERLKEIVSEEGDVLLYEPLAKHTTLRVGGRPQFWVAAQRSCVRQSDPLLSSRKPSAFRHGTRIKLLVRDGGIRGVVVHPCGGEFDKVDVSGNEITAGVGAKLSKWLCGQGRGSRRS